MNMKYLIIASLILAVLTIGAVSASDDVSLDGNLTASESAPDVIEESDAGDVDILSEGGELTSDQFDVEFYRDIDLDEGDTTVLSIGSPKEANGKIDVLVDNEVADSWTIDHDVESKAWELEDLGIDTGGTYLINVNFIPTEGEALSLLDDTLTVTNSSADDEDIEAVIDDQINLNNDYSAVGVTYKSDVDGTIDVYVDDTLKCSWEVDHDDDWKAWNLTDLEIATVGIYLIRVDFTPTGGQRETLEEKNVTVYNFVYDDDFDYNLYDLVDFGDVNTLVVYVERLSEVEGNLSVYVDNEYIGSKTVGSDEFYEWYLEDLGIDTAGRYIVRLDFKPIGNETRTLFEDFLTVSNGSDEEEDDIEAYVDDVIDISDDYPVVRVNCNADVEGFVYVYVDDVQKGSWEVDYGLGNYKWCLNDLGINESGTYQIEVSFVSANDETMTLAFKTVTVTDNGPAEWGADDFEFYSWDSQSIYYPDGVVFQLSEVPVLGTLNVYVDGKLVYYVDIDEYYPYSSVILEQLEIDAADTYDIDVKFEFDGRKILLDSFQMTVDDKLVRQNFDVHVVSDMPVNIRDKPVITVRCYEGGDGNISVEFSPDNVVTKPVTDENVYFSLDDLNLTDIGSYSFEIYYRSNNGENDIYLDYSGVYVDEEGEEHDLYLVIDVPEVYEMGQLISIWNKDFVSGILTVIVDDEVVRSCDLSRGATDFAINQLSIGPHNYTIAYSGDDSHDAFNMSGSFNVTYSIYVESIDNPYYGQTTMIKVYAYSDLRKNYVILNIAGKTYQVPTDTWESFPVDGLEMGDNFYTLTYEGDNKYPAKTVNGTVTVSPKIIVNDYVGWGSDDETVSLVLPDGAVGQLVVYMYDMGEYELFRSIDVAGGKNVMSLDDLDFGTYYIRASYENGSHNVSEWGEVHVIPSITVPESMYAQSQKTVFIKMPEKYEGNMSIKIIEQLISEVDTYDGDTIYEDTCEVTAGEGSIAITNPGGNGKYKLVVGYEDDDYSYEDEFDLYIYENDSAFRLNVTMEEVLYGRWATINVNWPDKHDGVLKVSVDGVSIPIKRMETDGDEYEWVILSNSLDMGEHTAVFTYYNDTYYNDASQIVKFTITPIIYGVSDERDFDDDLPIDIASGIGGVLVINIDGKEYFNHFINADYFTGEDYESDWTGFIALDNLTFAPHDYEFIFTCEGKTFTKTGSFNTTYYVDVNVDDIGYGENATVSVYVPFDEGTVTLAEGQNTYTVAIVDDGFAIFDLGVLDLGEHTIVVTVNGNDKYPSKTVEDSFTVYPNFNIPYDVVYSGNMEISLTLPSNATGVFTVDIYGDEYSADLSNGKATITLPNSFGLGWISIGAYYEGNYGSFSQEGHVNIIPNITVPDLTPEGDHVITIVMPEYYSGVFSLEMGESLYECDIVGGYGSITLSNLKAGSYYSVFEYSCDEYTYYNSRYLAVIGAVPGYKMNIQVPSEILMGGALDCDVTLPSYATGNLSVYIDGNFTDKFDIDGDDDNYIWIYLELDGLGLGEHDIEFVYSGDEHYPSVSESHTFNITPAIFPDFEAGHFTDEHPNYQAIDVYEGFNGTIRVIVDGNEIEVEMVNGQYMIALNNITCGIHNYTIIGTGNESFTKKGQFNVSFEMDHDKNNAIYGQEFEFNIILPEDATGYVNLTIEGKNYTSNVIGGKAAFKISGFDYGECNVTATYSGDGKYSSQTLEYVCYVNYEVVASINGTSVTVSVVLPEDATGWLCVRIDDGDEVMIELVDGKAEFTKSSLEVGEHSVNANCDCYEYEVSACYDDFDILPESKGECELTVIARDIDVGEGALIEISMNPLADGEVIVNVGGKNYTVYIYDGSGSETIYGLKPAKYDVTAYYEGNDYLLSDETATSFTVRAVQQDSGLTIFSPNISMSDDAVIEITINPLATGNVTVNVCGNNYTVSLTDGVGNVTLVDLAAGSYTAKAIYEGDENFLASEKTIAFAVSQGKMNPRLSLSVENICIGQDAVILVSINRNITSGVTVRVDGKDYDVEITDGQGSVTIADLGVDTYTVTATFEENENFISSVKTATFAVSKLPGEVSITVGSSYFVGDSFDIVVANSSAVNVTINGVSYSVAGGKVVVDTAALALGEYTVVASVAENDKYLANSTTATFKIIKRDAGLVVSANNITAGEIEVISITINENVTGSVVCSFENVTIPVNISQGKGNITLEGLAAGAYTVNVTFVGDSKFAAAERTVSFTVSIPSVVYPAKIVAKDLSAYYNKVSYSVTVYGTDGNVAAGLQVIFKVNGKKVGSAKTNSKGVATIKLKQVPKTYKITSEALGVNVTKKLTVKQVLTLKKVKVKKSAKKLVLTATLKEGKKAIKGKKLTFKFNGKKFKAKTNKKGVAKVTVKKKVLKKLKVGKKVKYQVTYLKDTVKKSVKVKK